MSVQVAVLDELRAMIRKKNWAKKKRRPLQT
jgi:hypothetical protein